MPLTVSTVVLNWNRDYLLERTLRSYADTHPRVHQVIVVDNASTDRSREVIEAARRLLPALQPILLDTNRGGEALNAALDLVTGDLVQFSENDQEFLPGWADHVERSFAAYPDLGQLSLMGVVPTDDEAWEVKPARVRVSQGTLLYQALGNVGTSSVLRTTLVRDHGIRVHNIPPREAEAFLFPDDARLSREIKETGYVCAWSDRYWVRNIGHELAEFDEHPEYYADNYRSKPWLNVDGWQLRVTEARRLHSLPRSSVVFPDDPLQPDAALSAGTRPARLWSMFDGRSPESEVLDFLYALVRLVKPEHTLESGTWLGRSAVAVARGLRENGLGDLVTLEPDPEARAVAVERVAQEGLDDLVTVTGDGGWPGADGGAEPFDLFVLHGAGPALEADLERCRSLAAPGATVVVHAGDDDPGPLRATVGAVAAAGGLTALPLPTPRGLVLARFEDGPTSG